MKKALLASSLAILAWLAACDRPTASQPIEARALPKDTPIDFALAWSWEDAPRDGAHSFRTDRGYAVTITSAHLGAASIEMVPCTAPEKRSALGAIFGVRSARANHGYVHDTAIVSEPVVASAFERAVSLGRAHASGAAYCGAHAYFAPLDATAADGFHLSRATLFVVGRYRNSSGVERLFSAGAVLPGGALANASVTAAPAHAAPVTHVMVVLHPSRALDRVDLDRMSDAELAYAFLRGLGHGATLDLGGEAVVGVP